MIRHAKLSASGSSRWLNCAGSVAAEAALKTSSQGSSAAQEGTACHELAEIVLERGINCSDMVGKVLPENNAYTVTQEQADSVQVYVDYVRSFSGYHYYEQRVDFSDWVPEGFGTADTIVIDGDIIRVIDLKMGRGIRVDAENNSQGMLYALGAYSDNELLHELKKVVVTIVQPRLDHIDEWEISVSDLLKWGAWASEQAALTLEPGAPRVPGDKQCQWCAVKAICPALKKYTENLILCEFEQLDAPNIETLTDWQLREIYNGRKLIEGWLSAVEQHIKDRAMNDGFEGFKIVAGRSLRKWADEEQAERELANLLGDDAFERKLLTPAKAEKTLGKTKAKEIADLIIKPEGAPTLAPESDKRPSIIITSKDFD